VPGRMVDTEEWYEVMAHSLSAKKRRRQNEVRRQYNRGVCSEVKTSIKKLEKAVEANEAPAAELALRVAVSKIDKSVKKGVLHRNLGARKKSQCQKLLKGLGSPAS